MTVSPLYLQELRQQGRIGYAPAPAAIAPTRSLVRSTRVTAAVDQYLREKAVLQAQGIRRTYGVLKKICLQHGVGTTAVCMRIKREHGHAT